MVKTKTQSTVQSYQSKPPVVAILGHVDHGKTSLLDAIAKTNVAQKEKGGITQAIGAFMVAWGDHQITFIDTPGHAAFAKMRARGANVCDVAILVVAADDGVMPQTKESIAHIKEAKIPYIVALTKTDLPTAVPEKVKATLLKEGVSLEGLGGDVPVVLVSSKTGKGIKDLLEVILLVAQLKPMEGSPNEPFEGIVIEAKLDRRKGPLATVIAQKGTLSLGMEIVAQRTVGKVRALLTDKGEAVKEVLAGTPVEVLGFSDVPAVGAKIVDKNQAALKTEVPPALVKEVLADSQIKRLALVLKADTLGSLEAILEHLAAEDVRIILSATGEVGEADILLARASGALVIGFNTTVSPKLAKFAESEGVLLKTYTIIYELLEEVTEAIGLFKEGKPQEITLGKAEVLAIFPYEKKKVAGCKVLEGRIARGDKVHVEREGEVIGEARVVSLRHGKEDIGKADVGFECGIILSSALDFAPQDMILSVR